jgi:hypothetical protein
MEGVSTEPPAGGNATGFHAVEYGIGGKWLALLREIAPGVTRVGVLRDPTATTGIRKFGASRSNDEDGKRLRSRTVMLMSSSINAISQPPDDGLTHR